jgi:hypothetical protein
MQTITAVLGHRVPCKWCGARVRLVLIPALGDRWQVCEDFERTPDNGMVELHQCPKFPGRADE